MPFKSRKELEPLIEQIRSDDSPVGMDAVYVHALILEKLGDLDRRLAAVEDTVNQLSADTD